MVCKVHVHVCYTFVYCCCILNFRCCPDRCKSLERHITLIFRKHKHGFYIIYGDLYIILYICNQFYVSFISTTMIVKFDTSYSKMAYHCFHIHNIPHMQINNFQTNILEHCLVHYYQTEYIASFSRIYRLHSSHV